MKVVIIGGTGLIGRKLAAKLEAGGHQVVAAAPSTGVNSLTGEGLAAALTGADVVVDVTNSPSFEDDAVMDFFRTSTGNLLGAAKAAGRLALFGAFDGGLGSHPRQRVSAGKTRPGRDDRGRRRPLHGAARDAVLRVSQGDRRRRHEGERMPYVAWQVPACRRGRCGRHPGRDRHGSAEERRCRAGGA